MQGVRVVDRPLGDSLNCFGQRLQRLEALRFGRLEHERLFHDEREVNRRRVEALFQQRLGHVEPPNAVGVLQGRRGQHAFVHADAVVGGGQRRTQPVAQPVGIQDRVLGDPGEPVATVDVDVGEGASQHHGVAVPTVHSTDRARRLHPGEGTVVHSCRLRAGEEFDQSLGDGDRSGARSPAAVGGGEGLVQIHVHDVEAHVTRSHRAENRVEVRAVVVEQTSDLVHRGGDLGDLLFEQTQRVRIGEHDAGDIGTE